MSLLCVCPWRVPGPGRECSVHVDLTLWLASAVVSPLWARSVASAEIAWVHRALHPCTEWHGVVCKAFAGCREHAHRVTEHVGGDTVRILL